MYFPYCSGTLPVFKGTVSDQKWEQTPLSGGSSYLSVCGHKVFAVLPGPQLCPQGSALPAWLAKIVVDLKNSIVHSGKVHRKRIFNYMYVDGRTRMVKHSMISANKKPKAIPLLLIWHPKKWEGETFDNSTTERLISTRQKFAVLSTRSACFYAASKTFFRVKYSFINM